MPTPEEKYYDGMNTLLAPVRWAKSLAQTVLLLAIAVFIGLAYPVIQLCNGEPLTLFSFLVPVLTLLIIFTFFYSPYYTIFAVFVGGFTIAAIAANTDMPKYGVCFLTFALFAVGILQKYIRNRIKYNRAYEEGQRKSQENQKQLKMEKEEKEAEAKQAAEESASAILENAEIVSAVAGMVSSLGPQVMEMMRVGKAISWGDEIQIVEYQRILRTEILQIISSFAAANGTVSKGLARLYHGIAMLIDICPFLRVSEAQDEIKQMIDEAKVSLPVTVQLLSMYDTSQKTNLAARAAHIFRSLVCTAAKKCRKSPVAVKIIADRYYDLLKPYLDSGGDGYAGDSSSPTGSQSNKKSVCEKCNKAFGLLDLPFGASDEEVKVKKRAFAELFHADRLAAMSDNARRIAQEQHKSVNEACDHILRDCKVRVRTTDGINGSESPSAPHQSTSEKASKRKSKRQPPPASSSDESKEAKQERGDAVRSDEDSIESMDAVRKKVDAATEEIYDFLEQRKKRRQTSFDRL